MNNSQGPTTPGLYDNRIVDHENIYRHGPMKPILTSIVVLLMLSATGSAEVFELVGGGRVVGKLLNPKEFPRRSFVVEVAKDVQVTLDAKRVKKVLRSRAEATEYERIHPTFPDTAEGQWMLAQWCRERRLITQRQTHLRRVIELAPDHADARRALGYSQVDGQWATREEVMTKRGYVRYKGQWKLPQEVELLEEKHSLHKSQQEWFIKLKRWRGWLGSDRNRQAQDNIRAIDDSAATKALLVGLRDESDPRVRKLFIVALAKIDTPGSARALAIASIVDPVEEVRLTCLDHLEKKRRPEVSVYFVGKLRDKDNFTVNLAAIGLRRMKDPSTIGPLINALVTVHKFKIVTSGGDGMSASFGSGGSGLSMGNKPKYIRRQIANQTVLDALVAITRCNFNFDKRAWKYWYAAQKKPSPSLDARRD